VSPPILMTGNLKRLIGA